MKLDVFSQSLDAILKDHFTAFVMKEINSFIGFEDSKQSLMNRIRFKYGSMMLGQNKFEELYSFYPLWYENNTLMWYEADWLANFTNPLETESGREAWELILNCTQSSEKLPKPGNYQNNIQQQILM